MTPEMLTEIVAKLMWTVGELAIPILAVSLLVGLLISLFQAVTQINESTLSFFPKALAIVVLLVFLTPWMLRKMTNFTTEIYGRIPTITRAAP